MSKVAKTFKIEHSSWSRSGRERKTIYEGTVEDLAGSFSYTLEIGNSWNSKIKLAGNIKSISSLISNINKAFDEKNANNYATDSVTLVD